MKAVLIVSFSLAGERSSGQTTSAKSREISADAISVGLGQICVQEITRERRLLHGTGGETLVKYQLEIFLPTERIEMEILGVNQPVIPSIRDGPGRTPYRSTRSVCWFSNNRLQGFTARPSRYLVDVLSCEVGRKVTVVHTEDRSRENRDWGLSKQDYIGQTRNWYPGDSGQNSTIISMGRFNYHTKSNHDHVIVTRVCSNLQSRGSILSAAWSQDTLMLPSRQDQSFHHNSSGQDLTEAPPRY
ncbi:hypothetical protein RRG08_060960 [Elysia crispata]|uniref:Uncharacterized protein n=1 Tax=Elysia crispata TaxID=231223 RepID=A0AAE1AV11_9GAST|nr:hypothetical protein RRG08_060960 [Elysia crispata]